MIKPIIRTKRTASENDQINTLPLIYVYWDDYLDRGLAIRGGISLVYSVIANNLYHLLPINTIVLTLDFTLGLFNPSIRTNSIINSLYSLVYSLYYNYKPRLPYSSFILVLLNSVTRLTIKLLVNDGIISSGSVTYIMLLLANRFPY